jgi:RNA methyltransferase, TrmH family
MLSRAQEKLVRGLGRRRTRAEEHLFLAEGVRVVEEQLAAGIVPRFSLVSSSLEDSERGRALARRLHDLAPVHPVSVAELNRLAGTRSPQGVLTVADIPWASLTDIEPEGAEAALVLDGVQDPGNIGTLARTAAAFGCLLLACMPGTVDPWNPKSVRASAGALFRLPVVAVGADEVWEWLGSHRFTVLGADAAGVPIRAGIAGERSALVVGNEGAGLSAGARDRCDSLVAVPMRGGTESLNVAVAAGILLYELSRGLG